MTRIPMPVTARDDAATSTAFPETAPPTKATSVKRRRSQTPCGANSARLRAKRLTNHSRADNPAPPSTPMWSKATSQEAATGSRLPMEARAALQMIRALTARGATSRLSGSVDHALCRQRNRIERFLYKLGTFPRITPRLDKLARCCCQSPCRPAPPRCRPRHSDKVSASALSWNLPGGQTQGDGTPSAPCFMMNAFCASVIIDAFISIFLPQPGNPIRKL